MVYYKGMDDNKESHAGTPMECRRCGVCCTKYQAIVNDKELQTIADYLGISKLEWLNTYAEPKWPGEQSHLIRHKNSACIFLEYKEKVSSCSIHIARPACCSDFIPSLEKKECHEGWLRDRKE